jgi:hypothetical protein
MTTEQNNARCRKCNDRLGHDDDGPTICRFCDAAHPETVEGQDAAIIAARFRT